VRYTVAAVMLALLARVGFGGPPARRGWPGRRDLLALAALAATGLVGFNICMIVAVQHADPAVVGTIVGAAPLGLALLGPLLHRQRPAARILGAAALIVAGTALVHGTGSADAIGTLAALGTLAGEIAFAVFAAMALPRLGAVRVSAYSCALAVPMFVVGALALGEVPRTPTAVEAATFGYLAVLLTVVAFVAWFTGLTRLGIARAGLFLGLLPVATIVVTSIQDGRWPVPAQAAGVLIVAAALTAGLGHGTQPDVRLASSPSSPPLVPREGEARRVRIERVPRE
jgi:drug/metabolite transporter (DMT)-like permease